jgi:phosphomannomutase
LHRNLQELSDLISNSTDVVAGLATDGDADRIGMYDENGNFVDSHHILLLLIHYLHKYKGMTGKVVVAFSVSNKIKKMCELYGLEYQVTKIGFKYISEIMVSDDVLVGGEESGGIAVKGHIPERDGIWDGLILLEYLAKTGKAMTEIVQEVYDVVGAFAYDRSDLHLTEELKQSILKNCIAGKYTAFGANTINRLEDIDGFKYYLGEDETVMIRASGTEPVLRVYAEAPTRARVDELLAAAKKTLLGE